MIASAVIVNWLYRIQQIGLIEALLEDIGVAPARRPRSRCSSWSSEVTRITGFAPGAGRP